MKYIRPLTNAVLARLKAVAGVTALVGTRIYTDIPQAETFPYVYVEVGGSDNSTKTDTESQFYVDVHVFSRKKSTNEAMNVMENVVTALNRQEANLTLDSGTLWFLHQGTLSTILKDTDGITWQGVVRFDAKIE